MQLAKDIHRICSVLGLSLIFNTACSTDITTGDNVQKSRDAKEKRKKEFDEQNSGSGDASGLVAACYEPAAEISDFLIEFCNTPPANYQDSHAKALKLVCDDKKIMNLFQSQCSYQGEGELKRYYRMLESTPLEDKESKTFSSLEVSSMKINKSPEALLGLLFDIIEDPNFSDTYETFADTSFSSVTSDRDAMWINYTVHVKAASDVIFDGRIEVFTFGDNLKVYFDRAVGNMTTIKKSETLAFLKLNDDGSTTIVSVGEKQIYDSGHHEIARRGVYDSAIDRAGVIYRNGSK